MTIKNLYPKSRPQTIYNVINGRPELPAASTFSRLSEATYVDRGGIIRTAAADEPRFNYDAETGEFLGLLLEPAIKNRMAGTGVSTTGWAPIDRAVIKNSGIAPNGKNEAVLIEGDGAGVYFGNGMGGQLPGNVSSRYSCFYKLKTSPCFLRIGTEATGTPYKYTRIDLATQTLVSSQHENVVLTKFPNGWLKVAFDTPKQSPGPTSITNYYYNGPGDPTPDWYMWGPMVTETPGYDPAFIECRGTAVTSSPDIFSLTSSKDFDAGFSLLLDTDSFTDDFLYKIKANDNIIAYLSNDGGTLDWNVNGTSAANSTPPLYPQVGAIQPGRVRTVSSFGAADGTIQNNYLYTTGLSFPTPAEVGSGADEIEFGGPQTLKAVYLWPGQLGNTEAVSVIKGEYNVVPIDTDDITNPDPDINPYYSFVYNTDPENDGSNYITLPYVKPTKSMRVYWGDGDKGQRYEPEVTPDHTYPYPGQYRIKIDGEVDEDKGGKRFDNVRLGVINNTITRVDQWAPQHRVGAPGGGFTGSDLYYMLSNQSTCKYCPPFEYTNLTNIDRVFTGCGQLKVNGWNIIPTQLQSCVNMNNCFNYLGGRDGATTEEKAVFPQLVTSSALKDASGVFTNTGITGFVTADGSPTIRPFTDTSGVTDFTSTFTNCKLTDIDVDISNVDALKSTFYGNAFVIMPNLGFENITNFDTTWYQCRSLKGFSSLPDTSSGINFTKTWNFCSDLEEFPLIDTSSGTNFSNTWEGCESLESFPLIDTSSGVRFVSTWRDCHSLKSFPLIDTTTATHLSATWMECRVLDNITNVPGATTSFPKISTTTVTDFGNAWQSCQALTVFPEIDTSNATGFYAAWYDCDGLIDFPELNFSKGINFGDCWGRSNNLANFPANRFDTTGELLANAFRDTWRNCALTKESIENILVSLDTNGAIKIELGIEGGTNADYKDWTQAAKDAYQNLIDKDWDIDLNDSTGIAPSTLSATSGFYVNHQDGVVSFGELTPGTRHASGKANQETFTDEGESIDRVLELDEDFFPAWDREGFYQIGARVKFGTCIFRALQQNDSRSFELPDDLEFNPDAEVATPANRQARWVEVYDPNYEEESNGGPI